MIVHYISPYTSKEPQAPPVHKTKYKGKHGTDDHRKFILMRALMNNTFTEGEFVKYKRNRAYVEDIFTEFELIEWDGLKPLFIHVVDHGNNSYQVHPSALRKVGK